jgi:hypothetical protein
MQCFDEQPWKRDHKAKRDEIIKEPQVIPCLSIRQCFDGVDSIFDVIARKIHIPLSGTESGEQCIKEGPGDERDEHFGDAAFQAVNRVKNAGIGQEERAADHDEHRPRPTRAGIDGNGTQPITEGDVTQQLSEGSQDMDGDDGKDGNGPQQIDIG